MQRNLRLLLVSLIVLVSIAYGQQQEKRIRTVTTGAPEGANWLSWDQGVRIGFVRGYLAGLHTGYRDGCFGSGTDKPASTNAKSALDSQFGNCLDKALRFSKEPEYYESTVTKFYETYQSDLGLPLVEVLRLLSDSESKNTLEIHRWFVSSNN